MFKKTKVREIIELLNKNLSAREIAEMLSVSRNTVSYLDNRSRQISPFLLQYEAKIGGEKFSIFVVVARMIGIFGSSRYSPRTVRNL